MRAVFFYAVVVHSVLIRAFLCPQTPLWYDINYWGQTALYVCARLRVVRANQSGNSFRQFHFFSRPFFELRCSKQISIVPPPICFPQVEYPYKRSLFNFSFRNLHSKFHILPFLCPIKNSTASNCSLLAFSNGVPQSTHSPTTTTKMQFIRATSVPPPHSTRIGSRLSLQQAGQFLHSVTQTAHLLPFSSGLYNLRCFTATATTPSPPTTQYNGLQLNKYCS